MKLKSFWKTKGFKSWFFTTIPITIIALTVGTVMTANDFLYNTVVQVFGGERRKVKSGDPSKYQYFESDYDSKKDVLEAANKLNEEIVSEGITLLKNDDSLPLNSTSKVTVFGKNSSDLVLGGSGSNATGSSKDVRTIYDSLESAGFSYNPVMKDFYDGSSSGGGRPASPDMNATTTGLTGFPTGETPLSSYTDNIKNSFDDYNDAAIVVISRIGGEGFDLPRSMFYDGNGYQNWSGDKLIPGARSKEDHYLQLDQNETDMLKLACDNFENVIVVLNSPTPLELGFLDDSTHYAYNDNIKGALWLGLPGNSGVMALGKVLNGEINPSGRTVDIYPRNFKNDPTWNNFSNNLVEDGNRYLDEEGQKRNAYFLDYDEGIYIGYRYYETRGYTDGEDWYDENVIYPFGYGLSYSNFTWEITDVSPATIDDLQADDEIQITVKVTNESDRPGKDVVELYYSAPYTESEIEKPHVVLGDFAKTELIPAHDSKTVTLSLKARDMASYDYNDANKNDFKGYELEEGDYNLYIAKNSHDYSNALTYHIAEDIRYETDDATGKEINNLFDDVSSRINRYLSRSDWDDTWPAKPTIEEMTLSKTDLDQLSSYKIEDDENDPWFSFETPTQSQSVLTYEDTPIKLWNLIGKDYDDPMWDQLLNQLTVGQMARLIQIGNYHTEAIENIDKPLTTDPDGPMGYSVFMGNPSVYDTCYYACESLAGSTWNEELMKRFGQIIGNESIIGNEKGDQVPYSGWYAPAANLHRSQFSGRNFEYYSEDPVLSGKLASAVIQGAKEKGVYTYMKHFALNEQETNRDTSGLVVWANEQAMREMYFVPFEEAVKVGGTTAMMSSFTRIGFTWAGGNYNLLTKLLREEWGFKGMVVTDYNLKSYMNLDQMIRAGGDLNLSQSKYLADTSSSTAITCIRKACKNILYTVSNSNAMNGFGEGVRYYYARPIWFIIMWSCIAAVIAGLLIWGVFIFIRVNKTNKAAKISGFYQDGSPYTKEKAKKLMTYRFTIPSIVYGCIAILFLAGTTSLSIYLMATPDLIPGMKPIADQYLGNIAILYNYAPITTDIIELKVGQEDQFFTVSIDSYNMSAGGYKLESSDTSILEISENGEAIAKKAGEVILTATAKNDSSLTTSIAVRVIDDTTPEKEMHSITVIGGYADYTEAEEGTIVTLKSDVRDDATFTDWSTDVADVWFNGNIFRMPDCDITITANYKYKEFTLTLVGATFEDGSTSKDIEAFSEVSDIIAEPSSNYYDSDELLGYRDLEGNIYSLPLVMTTEDITLSPYYRIAGTNQTLATGTRNYAGGTVGSMREDFNGVISTSYTIPSGQTGDFFDIMNLKEGTDGFLLNPGDTRNLIYTFTNKGDYDISFNYSVEYGSVDVTVKAHSYEVVEFTATLAEDEAAIRPYHHLTLNDDLAGETELVITAYEYDYYQLNLNDATFEDGSTSKTLKAGDEIPEVIFDESKFDLQDYETLVLRDEQNRAVTTMPYRDVTLSPSKQINGTSYYLATKIRKYNGATAKRDLLNGDPAIRYTLPSNTTGSLFDIQNEKTSTDGFFINYQETLRLFFRFQNDGDYAISFTYSVEYGEVNVTLAPHETKDIILEVANDKDVDGLRPYHHVTLTQDLAGQTDLVIAAFILNTNA